MKKGNSIEQHLGVGFDLGWGQGVYGVLNNKVIPDLKVKYQIVKKSLIKVTEQPLKFNSTVEIRPLQFEKSWYFPVLFKYTCLFSSEATL